MKQVAADQDASRGVSVVIKCLNESEKIDAAIASALAAAEEISPRPLEVVVADALSDDDTAARAARWADGAVVRVVQLLNRQDRGCGAGVALGWAWARYGHVLLMDGDMRLAPGFLREALARLESDPGLAGVGGVILDSHIRNGADLIRSRLARRGASGGVPWLEGGGLYRRTAVEQAGGGGDPRLAAFEEADLGLRLRRSGWHLERLARVAFRHDGHALGTLALLRMRWRSGRAAAAGRLLRLHLFKPKGTEVLRLLIHPISLGVWWLALPVGMFSAGPAVGFRLWLSASLCGLLLHAIFRRDLRHTWASCLDWHLMLAGLLRGSMQSMPLKATMPASHLLCEGPLRGAGQG